MSPFGTTSAMRQEGYLGPGSIGAHLCSWMTQCKKSFRSLLSGTMQAYGYLGSVGFNVAMQGPIFSRLPRQVESSKHLNKGGKQFLITHDDVQTG